jgi:ABC-type glycerol-3-phosphate transport system substrate-binding protein
MKSMLKIVLMVVLVMSLVVVGCSNDTETTESQDMDSQSDASSTEDEPMQVDEVTEAVNINFQIAWDIESGRGKNIQVAIDEFMLQNPNITVTMITGGDEQQTITSLLNDAAPEVIQLAVKPVKTIAAEGLLLDLSSREGEYKEIFYPTLVDFFKTDGKLYGAPWIGHTIELIYNKDLFEAAGLDPEQPPKTWDELMEFSEQIEANTDAIGLGMAGQQGNDAIWMSTPIIKSYGGEFTEIVDGKEVVAINTPEGIKGLQVYQDFALKYEGAAEKNGGNVMEDFRNSKIAMEFQGPWGVTDIWKSGNLFEVGTGLMPAGPDGRYADGGPYGLSIPVNLDGVKFDAAMALIGYLQTPEAQEIIMQGEYDEATDAYYPYRVPMRTDMADSDFFQDNPEFLVFIEGLEYIIDSFPTPAYNQLATEVITVELNKLASGATTPEEAAQSIEENGNPILRTFD